VVAVDVRNDLAVVRVADHKAAPLVLVNRPPRKGERAYSIGFPLDVGLTITEGISNGKVEDAFDSRIHYSGAVNGGMSGGPAFNATGEVIGINVSGYRFEQLVSFLVPAEHAVALLGRAVSIGKGPVDLKADILAQLRAHSSKLIGSFSGALATQNSAGYDLPAKLAPFVDCTANSDPTIAQVAQTTRISCVSKAGVYLKDRQSVGDIRYVHTVVTSEKLGPWRYAARLSNHAHVIGIPGSWRDVGGFACDGRVVALKGFAANVTVCTRGHRKNAGLYDFTVTVASQNGTQKGFTSDLTMIGLEYEPSMAFIRRYLEAMQWKPSQPNP
jgi:serine protease Do